MKKHFLRAIAGFMCLALLLPGCSPQQSSSTGSDSSGAGTTSASSSGQSSASSADLDWPKQPINIVVGFAAGGNTDLIPRTLGPLFQEELGVPVTVTNMPGGTGGIAADYVLQSEHDGYTLLQAPESLRILAAMEYHDSKIGEDWDILMSAIFNSVICVQKDSQFTDFGQLLEYVRANPNQLKISASSVGTMWHVQSQLLAKNYDFQLEFIPYQGSTPAQTALLSGEVDVCLSGIGEIGEMLRSGDVVPLCVFDNKAYEMTDVGTIPPITDWIPEVEDVLPFGSWQALVVPKDTPQEIKDKIEDVFLKAVATEEFADFVKMMEGEVLGWDYETSNEEGIRQMQRDSWLVYELGLTTVSPDSIGIPKLED